MGQTFPVVFAGVGPGAKDLMTLRACNAMQAADFVLYAGSLIDEQALEICKDSCVKVDSAGLSKDEQVKLLMEHHARGERVVRLHSGDPSLYGAINEQIEPLRQAGIDYEIVPGVTAAFAAAASLGVELTLPESAQSLVLSRGRGRTPLPEGQAPGAFAKSGATLAFYLSAGDFFGLAQELELGGLSPDTPAAIVYRASWPDEKRLEGTLGTMPELAEREGIQRQAVLLVGEALGKAKKSKCSKLYDASFSHGWRDASFEGSIALHPFSKKGQKTAETLRRAFGTDRCEIVAPGAFKESWSRFDGHVCIGASGIALRLCAPLLSFKGTDPALVCVDARGKFAISLAGGHLAGANRLARQAARALGGKEVISTGTDGEGTVAFDEAAGIERMRVLNTEAVLPCSKALLEGRPVEFHGPQEIFRRFWSETDNVKLVQSGEAGAETPGVWWGCAPANPRPFDLVLTKRRLVLGCGCKKGVDPAALWEEAQRFLERHGVGKDEIALVASATLKREEPALRRLAQELGVDSAFFDEEELNAVEGAALSPKAFEHLGIKSVCEAAALLGAGGERRGARIHVRKETAASSMTFALARIPHTKTMEAAAALLAPNKKAGRIQVVGLGSGTMQGLTGEALEAIREADALAGYDTYLSYIEPLSRGKEIISSGMRKEVERCRKALEAASRGKRVCVVSSGDAGILAMAGLLFELKGKSPEFADVDIDVVAGVTAASLAAASLGAPLQNGFSLVSLSDLLVPEAEVLQNIRAAAQSALPAALYNPAGKKRRALLSKAIEAFRDARGEETLAAVVKHAGQVEEERWVGPLKEFPFGFVDMSSLVIVGSARTRYENGALFESRGYEEKYFGNAAAPEGAKGRP